MPLTTNRFAEDAKGECTRWRERSLILHRNKREVRHGQGYSILLNRWTRMTDSNQRRFKICRSWLFKNFSNIYHFICIIIYNLLIRGKFKFNKSTTKHQLQNKTPKNLYKFSNTSAQFCFSRWPWPWTPWGDALQRPCWIETVESNETASNYKRILTNLIFKQWINNNQ